MGWTFTNRVRGTSNLDWFRQEFCPSEPERLIDVATKNGTAYCAYRAKDDRVVALVVLTMWVPKARDGFNFGYKDMDENMGPNEDDCPRRIFALLDPLPDDEADPSVETNWAAQWRVRVQANLDRPTVKKGDRVFFDERFLQRGGWGPLVYQGGRRGRNLFYSPLRHTLVRIPGWRRMSYTVDQAVAA